MESEAIPTLKEFRRARMLREFAASFSAATGVRVDLEEVESEIRGEALKYESEMPLQARR